ncbi:reverse transcriptase domain-containing protein [Tanacetum coccineum]
MRTRSSLEYTIPRRRNCRRSRHRQEAIPLNLDPIPMADNRTMAQMLQAPIEGYEDAIVVPPINANNFELKQPLINLVQSNKFTGRQDPHNHLRFFNKVTSTFRHPEVPNTSVKLLLFPFSLDGEARDWLDKEPPRSILTWDDLVSKFINQYFPPSKTTYYRNEIITFYQKPNEAFNEAWERFKGLLRQCPHHGFSELHQLDTFYNSLNSNDQDALDSAAGGNFLDKMPQEGLAIIESKSKVRYSRSRANDSRVSTDAPLSNSSSSNNSFDMQQIAASLEDKMTIKMNQMMSQMKALVVTPAPVKAVEEVCVTCGSNHNFNHCPLTRGGNDFPVFQDNIQQFQQTAAVGNFLQRNQPSNLASQMRPPEDEIQANIALMAFTDSEEIALLKRSVGHKEYLMGLLKTELEKISDESKKGFGYNAVPSPHPLILNRPTPLDLSYSGLEEFKQPEVNEYGPRNSSLKPTTVCDRESDNSKENTDESLTEQHKIVTETSSVKSPLKVDKDWKEKFFYPANHVREEESKKARENNDAPIIEDWVSDDEEEVEPIPKVEKKTVIPTAIKKESVQTEKPIRRSISLNEDGAQKLFNNAKACIVTVRSVKHCQYLLVLARQTVNTVRQNVNTVRAMGFNADAQDHKSGNKAHLSDFKTLMEGYLHIGGGANEGRFTGKAERKNRTLIEAARTMLADSKLPTTFWAEVVSTACYVQNRVLIVQGLINKTPLLNSLWLPKDNGPLMQQVNTLPVSRSPSVQTRRMTTSYSELGFLSAIYEGKTHQDLHTCLFACFLSQEEPKRVSKALSDPAWVEAMQEELLQFKLQNVWVLVDLPKGHRAIGIKWVYRNKKDDKNCHSNKENFLPKGHTQEEGIDYEKSLLQG